MRLPRTIVVWLVVALAGCALRMPPAAIDVNQADRAALATLPGLSAGDAERIIANRPYYTQDELVKRGVLTPAQYTAVADRLVVGPPGMPDYLLNVPREAKSP